MKNRDVVEDAFSNGIIHNKLLAPHQSGQLVMFMVEHTDLVFDIPTDVADMVCRRLHSEPNAIGNCTLQVFLRVTLNYKPCLFICHSIYMRAVSECLKLIDTLSLFC